MGTNEDHTALSDTNLRNLKAKDKPYQIADGRGLLIEANPGGKKTWRPGGYRCSTGFGHNRYFARNRQSR
jgi:hypothetical protein